jgi:hypothetical protein
MSGRSGPKGALGRDVRYADPSKLQVATVEHATRHHETAMKMMLAPFLHGLSALRKRFPDEPTIDWESVELEMAEDDVDNRRAATLAALQEVATPAELESCRSAVRSKEVEAEILMANVRLALQKVVAFSEDYLQTEATYEPEILDALEAQQTRANALLTFVHEVGRYALLLAAEAVTAKPADNRRKAAVKEALSLGLTSDYDIACYSITRGNWPERVQNLLRDANKRAKPGLTVAEVIQAEKRAVAIARGRLPEMDD